MKKIICSLLVLILISVLSSCSVVTGIFKAGMGFGIVLVVLIIGLVLYFVLRARSK